MKSTIDKLLDRIKVLKHPADLDLLLFFARHPRALLTSEDLAAYVRYDLQQIARSLDILIDAKIVKRLQNPTHSARMYVLDTGGSPSGWLPAFLRLASTREGRAGVMAVLKVRATAGPRPPAPGSATLPSGNWRWLMPDEDMLKTGIKGFDPILAGGIPRGNLI
jgi:hypothetical protein